MISKISTLIAAWSIFITSCQNTNNTDKPADPYTIITKTQNETNATSILFTEAKNYFVNNRIKKLDHPKIETAREFHEIFGLATTMGKEGKPTEIDFTRQYVIAIILPETEYSTSIEILHLQKDERGEITLTYKLIIGEKQSFTMIPNKIIIVDKKEKGKIRLEEVK